MMTPFVYQAMFPMGEDDTPYRRLTGDHVSQGTFEGKAILKVANQGLTLLAEQAFRDVSISIVPATCSNWPR